MKKLISMLCLLLLVGCSAAIEDYRGTGPELRLEQFFDGKLKAEGMVQDFRGKVLRRFTVDMQASWHNGQLTLDEDFLYDDGETQKRIWYIKTSGPGRYQGRAADILGIAQGQALGSALHWQYDMMLPLGSSHYRVSFDDWMFLIDNNTLLNRSDINKFGLTVAEVTLVIRKLP
ncbi:hypothetical protein NFHSH190041_09940 [Shewanella sp. NFH-SH190041]|uniref:DUF3833 domain-containing protein n=1 Tax=Shewanella sp. NFH-SH190041 TaxID=2950245 RepID=UPI0021C454CC|nr:DUF3833 domain-containing protein [Shewanella sp. NFH-SH190041]BDM63542.1 hypothetical protein NFHSH190041_09940 [Shewanella sp. NFH-SH190041]